jgi:cation:H+ antiporter
MGQFNISPFILGLIVFSIGTNLPELTVVITSWRKKIRDISFSHMLGSAIVNALVLGIMAMIHPVSITVNFSYSMILYFFILISIMLLYFYRSNKALSRPEGVVLILIFLIFTYLQYLIQ